MSVGVADHWDSIYSTIASDRLSWWQSSADASLSLIADTGLSTDCRIVDVGAGTSLLVDGLLAHGYTSVALVDVSAAALEQTGHRLASHPTVEYVVGDVAGVDLGQVDLWHDRAMFHFLLDPNDRARYVDSMFRHIRPGGYAVLAVFAEDGPESCSGLPTMRYSVEELAAALAPEFQLVHARRVIHTTPAGGEQAFNYALMRRQS